MSCPHCSEAINQMPKNIHRLIARKGDGKDERHAIALKRLQRMRKRKVKNDKFTNN